MKLEKSLLNRIWSLREHNENELKKYKLLHENVPDVVLKILLLKNIPVEDVSSFMSPKIKHFLKNPFQILDMEKGANRIVKAIQNKEKIAIFGDYDVDGATSSAIFVRYLRSIKADVIFYIPDRIEEGYGPNLKALKKLQSDGATLIITVDCGTLSSEVFKQLRDEEDLSNHTSYNNIDIIVVDHHLSSENLPDICAVINPNRFDEQTEYKYLAAVGVSFLVIAAINSILKKRDFFNNIAEPDILNLLDIVAIGTFCDVVPLVGLNRAFVTQGLKILTKPAKPGLEALCEIAKISETINTYHLGYVIGPRINAGGRVGKSDLGLRLLISENKEESIFLAEELEKYNIERRNIEKFVIDESIAQYENQKEENEVIVVCGEYWHQGVVGIAAGRLKEKYNKPVAVITFEEEKGKAFCRSIKGFDFGAAILEAKNLKIVIEGGGHAMAAGFSIKKDEIKNLQSFLNEKFLTNKDIIESFKECHFDIELSIAAINLEIGKHIESIGPFGAGNYEPKVLIKNVIIHSISNIGAEHFLLIVSNKDDLMSTKLKVLSFRSLSSPIGSFFANYNHKEFHIIGHLKINKWKNRENIDFILEDIILA